MTCLKSVIESTDDAIKNHLDIVVPMLHPLLPTAEMNEEEEEDEEMIELESSALDTLAALVSSAGEACVPLARDSLTLTSKLVTAETNSEIRRAAMNLACSVVSLPNAPDELVQVIPRLFEIMVQVMKSDDGINVKFVGDADEDDPNAAAEAFEAIDEDDDGASVIGDQEEEVDHFIVENSYMEECHAILSNIIRMAQKVPEHVAPQW